MNPRRLKCLALVLSILSQPLVNASFGGSVQAWLTTADFKAKLAPQAEITLDAKPGAGVPVVVDVAQRFQSMDGFGLTITQSSAWLITHRLTPAKRAEVMESLFGRTGIRMSFLRQVIGTSDFTSEMYSYDDGAPDPSLARFSVAKDEAFVIPVVKEALALSGEMKVMASPWSPPGWMKTSGSMIGGTLKPEFAAVYAAYFVKFVKAYEERGIPIYALTPQNEPGYSPSHYPGMRLSAREQALFIKKHLGPALKAAGVTAKLVCFDHNYDDVAVPLSILADKDAAAYLDGSAFHHYGGLPTAMSRLHRAHPDKDIWFTEGGNGEWNDTFDNLVHEMIAIPRNWAKSIVFWNVALDQLDGPSLIGDHNTNQGMVTIRSDAMDHVTFNPQFYYMGHTSKFVRPGAVRVASTHHENELETVAYQNPDGSKVLVVFNQTRSLRQISVQQGDRYFHHGLPGHSLMTFVWE